MNREEFKIQPGSEESYSAITKALLDKKTEFHTYKIKSERNFNVVLRGMHYSTSIDGIKQELTSQGHEVVNVSNILDRTTKKPTSLFWVNLKSSQNNKNVYGIKTMMRTKVVFEPPKPKRVIPQCTNCQRYGHTVKFCHNSSRCVKCTGNHHTKDCQRTTKTNDVKCVLCENNHPANYKGCQVYKDLQNKLYPKLRIKEHRVPTAQEQTVKVPTTQKQPHQVNSTNPTYASVVTNRTPATQTTQSLRENSDISELKSMLKTLMQQMGTILNLLTAFINRTSNV